MKIEDLVKVEIGCGKTKTPGFIGVDRFELEGVDIVADINKGLPFESNSVDVIFACHSLEHMDDIQCTMEEIYRISKHGALICVLAPYYNTYTNIANHYHKSNFNEDTFRFFTTDKKSPIDLNEFYNAHSYRWGLSDSDNSELNIRLTMLDMEFFYFPSYVDMDEEKKRNARRSLNNVCDQIYYVMVANKSGDELDDFELEYYKKLGKKIEPEIVGLVRNRPIDLNMKSSFYLDLIEKSNSDFENYNKLISEEKTIFENRMIKLNDEVSNKIDQISYELSNLDSNQELITKKIELAKVQFEENFELINNRRNIEILNKINCKFKKNNLEYSKKHKLLEGNFSHLNNMYEGIESKYEGIESKCEDIEYKCIEIKKKCTSFLDDNSSYKTEFENRIKELEEKDKQNSAILHEIFTNSERKRKVIRYNKKNDIFHHVKLNFRDFIDGLTIKCSDFNKNSILNFSKMIPFDSYFEYNIIGDGDRLNYFISSKKGSRFIIELVKDGEIIYNDIHVVIAEGSVKLKIPYVTGKVKLRIRGLDNYSIGRILETNNRKLYFISKIGIAAYINSNI